MRRPDAYMAHDEGVDLLCHLGWEEDLRPGTWAFIGQVTVGRSDTWEEENQGNRARSNGSSLPAPGFHPSPFLAVPHHVERSTMELLTIEEQCRCPG